MILTSFDDTNQEISTTTTKKRLFPKFQLIPISRLQVMHDYVHWHCHIDCCVKLILVDENLCENYFYFTLYDHPIEGHMNTSGYL